MEYVPWGEYVCVSVSSVRALVNVLLTLDALDSDPASVLKSGKAGRSGIPANGGTKIVERLPEPEPTLDALSSDRIVRTDPVGERVWERSGTVVTSRLIVSLYEKK